VLATVKHSKEKRSGGCRGAELGGSLLNAELALSRRVGGMGTAAKKMLAGAALMLAPPCTPAAFAHHMMGGELPRTAWQGLLSGLAHPIIGIDHFAFIVGVGLMSLIVGRVMLLPLLFMIGSITGCFVHVYNISLPWSELAIAISLALAAAMVGARARAPIGILATLITVAGAAHGYAYGESIVGAEPAPLAAYIIGFGAIQYAIAVGSCLALSMLARRHSFLERTVMRAASGGFALVACIMIVNLILSG
jgi:urease accessory protein